MTAISESLSKDCARIRDGLDHPGTGFRVSLSRVPLITSSWVIAARSTKIAGAGIGHSQIFDYEWPALQEEAEGRLK